MLTDDLLTDRIRGLVLGAACADAIGAPFEGSETVSRSCLNAWCTSPRQLRYTDDTTLLLALADHLCTVDTDRPLLEQDVGRALAAAWEREPGRGFARGAAECFRLLTRGAHWMTAANAVHPGGSFGNGAAMRVAPVAVVGGDLEHIAALARATARPTHRHELGQDSAAAQAIAVGLVLSMPSGASAPPIDPIQFVGEIERHTGTGPLAAAYERVGELTRAEDPSEVTRRLGASSMTWESVPAALVAFLRHADNYADAVRFAVSLGGDTDTVAAMAGALAGARGGVGAIPVAWLARLENASHVCAVADDLVRRANRTTAPLPRAAGRCRSVGEPDVQILSQGSS